MYNYWTYRNSYLWFNNIVCVYIRTHRYMYNKLLIVWNFNFQCRWTNNQLDLFQLLNNIYSIGTYLCPILYTFFFFEIIHQYGNTGYCYYICWHTYECIMYIWNGYNWKITHVNYSQNPMFSQWNFAFGMFPVFQDLFGGRWTISDREHHHNFATVALLFYCRFEIYINVQITSRTYNYLRNIMVNYAVFMSLTVTSYNTSVS